MAITRTFHKDSRGTGSYTVTSFATTIASLQQGDCISLIISGPPAIDLSVKATSGATPALLRSYARVAFGYFSGYTLHIKFYEIITSGDYIVEAAGNGFRFAYSLSAWRPSVLSRWTPQPSTYYNHASAASAVTFESANGLFFLIAGNETWTAEYTWTLATGGFIDTPTKVRLHDIWVVEGTTEQGTPITAQAGLIPYADYYGVPLRVDPAVTLQEGFVLI